MVFSDFDRYEMAQANAGIALVARSFANTLPLLLDGIACIGPTDAVLAHYANERKALDANAEVC